MNVSFSRFPKVLLPSEKAAENSLVFLVASAIQESLNEKLHPQGHQATELEDGPLKKVMGMDVQTRNIVAIHSVLMRRYHSQSRQPLQVHLCKLSAIKL